MTNHVDGSNDVPQICSKYRNTDCWNGSATVPVNNVEFDSKTISGQRKLVFCNKETCVKFYVITSS